MGCRNYFTQNIFVGDTVQRYLLKLSFDGTSYHGWQVQPNGITVQEQLQLSFKKLYGFAPSVTGCSRTDAGVHANMFFCHFDLDNPVPTDGIVFGLNSVLPEDIRVLDCCEVDLDFHCRYNAKSKNYIYKIYRKRIQDPFSSRYSYRYCGPLNIEDINYFCSSLIGEHDFAGFSSINRSVDNTIRNVTECSVYTEGDFLVLSITANGFLYNMVRIIVGTAIGVGSGKIDKNIANDIFICGQRNLAGATAPAKGLFLNNVVY